ncbi:MAG: LysE family translocator [Pseudomonadota bacterium]
MTYDLLLALAAFALVSSLTPGPNNLMLMASGANFGFLRTVPHMLGVALGFMVMVILVGLGLEQIFDRFPITRIGLQMACIGYLLWLAWKIAHAAAPGEAAATARPMTFWQAAAFQWVNPKAWAMALTALGAYAPSQEFWAVVLVAVIFGAINLPSVSTWVVLGQQVRRWLSDPVWLRRFNWTMAALLILSVLPLLR